ncbi:hypothetical protein Bpfe_008377 [Biomphalaria pfeifferi]|uniref:Uncharacterized protein n=1 Tax=Biomphalaria pfeifferi TaxID=112525 RepID=A0AAD8BWS9_BIOPF|nr:hypothetical protein Bpfe_008377 [Biomphalaria pfeifferi]
MKPARSLTRADEVLSGGGEMSRCVSKANTHTMKQETLYTGSCLNNLTACPQGREKCFVDSYVGANNGALSSRKKYLLEADPWTGGQIRTYGHILKRWDWGEEE